MRLRTHAHLHKVAAGLGQGAKVVVSKHVAGVQGEAADVVRPGPLVVALAVLSRGEAGVTLGGDGMGRCCGSRTWRN